MNATITKTKNDRTELTIEMLEAVCTWMALVEGNLPTAVLIGDKEYFDSLASNFADVRYVLSHHADFLRKTD